jgi:hypothetical protein
MQEHGYYGYYNVDIPNYNSRLFSTVQSCVETSSSDLFEPKESSSCDVYWCVL